MAQHKIAEWTLINEVRPPKSIKDILIPNEKVYKAFKTLRDVAVFTNKRIIMGDVQGIRGKKVEVYSIPYSSIVMWSSENEGTLDLSAEIQIWTRIGEIKLNLRRGVDVRSIDQLMARAIL